METPRFYLLYEKRRTVTTYSPHGQSFKNRWISRGWLMICQMTYNECFTQLVLKRAPAVQRFPKSA